MTNEELVKELKELFTNFRTKPVLFVGSGMSKRYIDLPSWQPLLEYFANKIDPTNPYIFKKYLHEANTKIKENNLTPDMQLPIVASFLEKDYNSKFYSETEFEKELKSINYKEFSNTDCSAFKIAISLYLTDIGRYTSTYHDEIDNFKSLKNKVSNIITTNYDTFLEKQFTNYNTVIGQENMLSRNFSSIGNIYKIHGSVTNPSSIIITQEDYNKFNERSKFISAKLLTMFIEYPIIFLGYGLNDSNIKNICQDIQLCLNEDSAATLSKTLIFIERADSIQNQDIINVELAGLQMKKIVLYDYNILYQAFDCIVDSIDVATLRQLENQIVQLVQNTDKKVDRVYATSLENEELDSNNLAIYIAHDSSVFDIGYACNQTNKYM